jgi:glycosyltransferase involved in cell wall biosynthesis
MTPHPLISVIMPVRNAQDVVRRAIESIGAQTLTGWELVVVNDGSTDSSLGILRESAGRDRRVRVIDRPAAGIATALNEALASSRGAYVARMDADDIAAPERLAAQAAFLSAPGNRDIGLVGCLVEFGGDRAVSTGYALHVDWINSLVTPEQIALNRFIEAPFAHPSVMFRRELAARHGGYRSGEFPEDYELWLRWMDAGVRMAKVPRVLLRWNDPPTRSSRNEPRYSPDAFFRVKAEWIVREVERTVLFESRHAGVGTPTKVSPDDAKAGPGRRRILVWGAGRPTRKRAAHLAAHGLRIDGYVDVDRKKTTPALGGTGLPVVAPPDLRSPGEVFVLVYVSSRGARDFIRAELGRRGFVEGGDFLMCA